MSSKRRLVGAALLAFVSVIGARGEGPADPVVRLRDDLGRRPYLEPSWIRLEGEGGTLTIRGRVPDEGLARLVELVARNEPGVERVRNELRLDPSLGKWTPTPHDRRLQTIANVRRLLASTAELERYETLGASLDRRVFILHGSVMREDERELAFRLVATHPGVQAVVDRISVRPDAPRRAIGGPLTASDAALLHAIAVAIRAESSVDGVVSVDITIRARDVLLRGVAGSLVAHDLAYEIARATLRAERARRARVLLERRPLTRFLREHGPSHEGVTEPSEPLPALAPIPDRVVSQVLVTLERGPG
jgi:osmotically-inducible protein OsmY